MASANSDKDVPTDSSAVFDAGELSVDDPALHEQIIEPWQLCNTPAQRGQFGYQIRYLKTPTITVYQEQFSLNCRLRGHAPPNTFVFCVPIHLGGESSYWNKAWCGASMPIMWQDGLDVTVDAGHRHLILLIDQTLLSAQLPATSLDALKQAAISHQIPASADQLWHFGNWLQALLQDSGRRPQLFASAVTVKALEEEIFCRLANLIPADNSHASRRQPSGLPRGFNHALELARTADPTSLTIPQLSAAAGISIRNLEYAFREAFELSPLAYMRLQRFHLARRHLAMAEPGEKTVTHIAYEYGFNHLGRFSAQYRRLFYELPSDTLTRRYTTPGGDLRPLISNLRKQGGARI